MAKASATKQPKTIEQKQQEHVAKMDGYSKTIKLKAEKLGKYRHDFGATYSAARADELMGEIEAAGVAQKEIAEAIAGIVKEMRREVKTLIRKQTAMFKKAGVL